jgi:hypothetical protein
MTKLDWLWPYPQKVEIEGEFCSPKKVKLAGANCFGLAEDIEQIVKKEIASTDNSYEIKLEIAPGTIKQQGYCLNISDKQTQIISEDEAGLFYGVQTFLQIIAINSDRWPIVKIIDWPSYKKRCFMVDMGRSLFSLTMLKRIVRILARLKMNQLHLHVYDDELCGLRFEGFPFGSENPYAISLSDLAELVRYARNYHVEIVPELEAWGHVGSLVYHRKDLYGGTGIGGYGSSFLICEDTFTLMDNLIDQVVALMGKNATIHLGLDEAEWFVDSSMPKDYTPEKMIGRYYEILKKIEKKYNKNLILRIWADHAGRPVPKDIQKNVIIEPWQYWIANKDQIKKHVKKYSGAEKMRWMAGAGQSSAQFRGAYSATRYWCRTAVNSPNLEGINITLWGWNDLDQKMISLFGGAYYTWNPFAAAEISEIEDYESYDSKAFPIMCWWQKTFKDACPDNIRQDNAPVVHDGIYFWGDKHGQPVAPTVIFSRRMETPDYVNEHKANVTDKNNECAKKS